MKKLLPALVCGFGAGVLSIVPIVKSASCCLIIPAAAVFALILKQRSTYSNDKIRPSEAVVQGLLTGIFAAVFATIFESLIIFITRSSDITGTLPELERVVSSYTTPEMADQMMNMLYKVADDVKNYGFSLFYTLSILFSSLFINSIFGMAGGLLGMQLINNRIEQE